MKQALFIVSLTLALTACGGRESAPADSAPQTSTPQVAAGTSMPQPMPQGFALKFPYHFIEQSTGPANNGEPRDRFTVEFLDGDINTVAGSLMASAVEAGFQNGSWSAHKGMIQVSVNKAGYGQMRAVVQRADRRKLSHPAAKGLVILGWPTQSAAPQATEAPTETGAATAEPAEQQTPSR